MGSTHVGSAPSVTMAAPCGHSRATVARWPVPVAPYDVWVAAGVEPPAHPLLVRCRQCRPQLWRVVGAFHTLPSWLPAWCTRSPPRCGASQRETPPCPLAPPVPHGDQGAGGCVEYYDTAARRVGRGACCRSGIETSRARLDAYRLTNTPRTRSCIGSDLATPMRRRLSRGNTSPFHTFCPFSRCGPLGRPHARRVAADAALVCLRVVSVVWTPLGQPLHRRTAMERNLAASKRPTPDTDGHCWRCLALSACRSCGSCSPHPGRRGRWCRRSGSGP